VTWHDLSGYSTFEKARRHEIARRLTRLVRGKDADTLLPLDEVRDKLGLHEQWYVGIQTIPVAKIVGTVDRAADFDRTFLPKRNAMEERWRRVEQTFATEAFPPIITFKVDDAYFIEDGHHRVAIARQRKIEYIDAEVTEVKSPVEITAATDVADLVHLGLHRWFMRSCDLDRVRPRAAIEPSRPHDYGVLLDILHAAGFELMMQRAAVVSSAAAAAHWYDNLYMPTVGTIRAGRLPVLFPRATETDLYLWVHAQHRELESITAPHSVDDAVASAESTATDSAKAKARMVIEDVKERLKPPATQEDTDDD
jgi:hypothetical protein